MGEPILLIHDLSALPYAVFRAGHVFPVQNFNPAATHRILRPRLSATTREAVQAAVEAESLWTDDTLRRWLERDYDLVLFQDNEGGRPERDFRRPDAAVRCCRHNHLSRREPRSLQAQARAVTALTASPMSPTMSTIPGSHIGPSMRPTRSTRSRPCCAPGAEVLDRRGRPRL